MNGELQTIAMDVKELTAWTVSVVNIFHGLIDWWFDKGIGPATMMVGFISVIYILVVIHPRKKRLLDLQIQKMEREENDNE